MRTILAVTVFAIALAPLGARANHSSCYPLPDLACTVHSVGTSSVYPFIPAEVRQSLPGPTTVDLNGIYTLWPEVQVAAVGDIGSSTVTTPTASLVPIDITARYGGKFVVQNLTGQRFSIVDASCLNPTTATLNGAPCRFSVLINANAVGPNAQNFSLLTWCNPPPGGTCAPNRFERNKPYPYMLYQHPEIKGTITAA